MVPQENARCIFYFRQRALRRVPCGGEADVAIFNPLNGLQMLARPMDRAL
jgi:hypothetical protein